MISLLENNADFFIQVFDVLLHEQNYPVVIYCMFGKDKTALVSALILFALGVSEEDIMNDFLLSNKVIDYKSLISNADNFPINVQETFTAAFSSHKETIQYAFDLLRNEYVSADNYLEHEVKLTHKKRERLRELLLYPVE
jgi:protein-tyrosine phosphatase